MPSGACEKRIQTKCILLAAWIGVIENVAEGKNCATLTEMRSPPPPLSAFLPSHSRSSSTQSGGGLEADSRNSSRGSLEELSQSRHREASSALSFGSTWGAKQRMLLDYNVYMAKYINPQGPSRSPGATDSLGHSPESSPKTSKKVIKRGTHERLKT